MGEICDPPSFLPAGIISINLMVGSSFKTGSGYFFTDLGIIPKQFALENYEIGWKSNGR